MLALKGWAARLVGAVVAVVRAPAAARVGRDDLAVLAGEDGATLLVRTVGAIGILIASLSGTDDRPSAQVNGGAWQLLVQPFWHSVTQLLIAPVTPPPQKTALRFSQVATTKQAS